MTDAIRIRKLLVPKYRDQMIGSMKTQAYAYGNRDVNYFCPSVRMGMATAVALEVSNLLQSAHVDFCLPPGRTVRFLEHIAGTRVKNRVIADIPMKRIQRHPRLAFVSRVRWRQMMAGRTQHQ